MTDTGAVGAREFGSARMEMQPLADADAPLYARIYGDAELMRFVAPPLSGAALQRSFNAALESTRARNFRGRYWRMVERAGGQDIGILGLSRAAADAGGGAELGCMILGAWQAQGFAIEGLRALVEHAFKVEALPRLVAMHMPAHAAAVALVARLGFQREPTLAGAVYTTRWSLVKAP